MTGKSSIYQHGSGGGEVACNLSANFSCNAVNRSFNTFARGQFLQARPEILIVRGDDLIASKVPYDRFLLAASDNVDRLESILSRQLKHELPNTRCSRRLH